MKNRRMGMTLPLIAVQITWWALLLASYLDLPIAKTGNPEIKLSTYVVLGALVIGSLMVLAGFKDADARHAASDAPLERAVYRFAGLMIVLSLAALTIFAFATFIGSFNTVAVVGSGNSTTLVGRLVGVYLPIIIAAGAIVFVLLESMMKRKSAPVESAEMSETQKALAFGYSLPILGTAFAVILGLIFYDAQGQKLEIWSWVVIQAIVAASLVLGTRSAAKARTAKAVPKPAKVNGAAGAVILNYVISIVFSGVVGVMSFSYAQSAIDYLRGQDVCVDNACTNTRTITHSIDASWWFQKMLPAWVLLLLVEAAIYFVITARNKSEATS
jgi:Na+-translocating ferredoxin:NAD+ oxidoreductase RnfA subunit